MLVEGQRVQVSGAKSALVAAPGFQGYGDSLSYALSSLGYDASLVEYDRRDGPRAKAAGKVRLDVPDRLGFDTWQRQRIQATDLLASRLRYERPDVLVVIRGDAIDPQLVADYVASGGWAVLWLYDELRRTRHDREALSAYSRVATYSRADHASFSGWDLDSRHVPNGVDARFLRSSAPWPMGPDLVFVGARYGRRQELLEGARDAGLSVRAYGRDWSRHPVDRLRALTWRRPDVPAAREVSRAAAADVMSQAVGALNVHHDQDGFSPRTFEIPGGMGLQLIDRVDVDEFYDPGREVLVYGGLDDLVEQVRRAQRDPGWATEIRQAAFRRTASEHTYEQRALELVAP